MSSVLIKDYNALHEWILKDLGAEQVHNNLMQRAGTFYSAGNGISFSIETRRISNGIGAPQSHIKLVRIWWARDEKIEPKTIEIEAWTPIEDVKRILRDGILDRLYA